MITLHTVYSQSHILTLTSTLATVCGPFSISKEEACSSFVSKKCWRNLSTKNAEFIDDSQQCVHPFCFCTQRRLNQSHQKDSRRERRGWDDFRIKGSALIRETEAEKRRREGGRMIWKEMPLAKQRNCCSSLPSSSADLPANDGGVVGAKRRGRRRRWFANRRSLFLAGLRMERGGPKLKVRLTGNSAKTVTACSERHQTEKVRQAI